MNLQRASSGWSPEKRLWCELRELSHDLKWTRVSFDLHRRHLVPAHSSGVYLICARAPAEGLQRLKAYTVLYAGSVVRASHGLRRRFSEHISYPSPLIQRFVRCFFPSVDFWFAPIADQTAIEAMETLLISTFNPPCNQKLSPRSGVILARIGTGTRLGTPTHELSA